MQIQTWHITGRSGFHLGQHGLGQETSRVHIPSDALLSAILARLGQLKGGEQIAAWVELLQADPPAFVLTSAFPRAGEVLFFPLPADSLRNEADGTVELKKLKKIRYVSRGVFAKLLAGEPLAQIYLAGRLLQGEAVLYEAEEAKGLPEDLRAGRRNSLWQMESRPRVAVDRVTNASNLFHIGRTVFQPGCGLWFGVRWFGASQAIGHEFEEVLQDLGDAGLGGERSAGYGAAEIQGAEEIELPEANGSAWVALSRYLPRADEMVALQAQEAAYQLEQVGGWVEVLDGPAQRRRVVNMLSEGAVLGPTAHSVPGQIAQVEPRYENAGEIISPLSHPVYRSGLALTVARQNPGLQNPDKRRER